MRRKDWEKVERKRRRGLDDEMGGEGILEGNIGKEEEKKRRV